MLLSFRPGGPGAVRPAHGERQVSAPALGGPALRGSCSARCSFPPTSSASTTPPLYIPSGLSAVIFASASIFNGLNLWLFEGKRPTLRWLQGRCYELFGTLLLFWPCAGGCATGCKRLEGLAVCPAGGTLCFSLGNLVSARASARAIRCCRWCPGAWCTVWRCCWAGSRYSAQSSPCHRPRYLASMVYLAHPSRLRHRPSPPHLVGRISASKTAYATVLFPWLPHLSTFCQGASVWQTVSIVGVVVSLIGNLVIFAPRQRRGAGRYRGCKRQFCPWWYQPLKVTAFQQRAGRRMLLEELETLCLLASRAPWPGREPPLHQPVGGEANASPSWSSALGKKFFSSSPIAAIPASPPGPGGCSPGVVLSLAEMKALADSESHRPYPPRRLLREPAAGGLPRPFYARLPAAGSIALSTHHTPVILA